MIRPGTPIPASKITKINSEIESSDLSWCNLSYDGKKINGLLKRLLKRIRKCDDSNDIENMKRLINCYGYLLHQKVDLIDRVLYVNDLVLRQKRLL